MSTLDDIAQERQRIAERLARLDGERAKMAEQLAELDAAERVLARLTEGRPRRGRPRAAESAASAPPRRGRQRRRGAVAKSLAPSLGDAALRAVETLGNGVSAEDVRGYLAKELSMTVRPNHLGMALQRHLRAGRLEQRDSRWWTSQPLGESATTA